MVVLQKLSNTTMKRGELMYTQKLKFLNQNNLKNMKSNQFGTPRRRNPVDGFPEKRSPQVITGEEIPRTPPGIQTNTGIERLRVAPWLKVSGHRGKSTLRLGLLSRSNRDLREYETWIEQFGEVVLVKPYEFRADLDLLILPGGPDLPPTYTPYLSAMHGSVAPEWIEFMDNTLQLYIESGTKIFGICLGFQMLSAYFGGTLFSHIPEHDSGRHLVYVEDSWLQKLEIDEQLQYVNSRHHQAVMEYPKNLVPLAWSLYGEKKDWIKKTPEPGLLEAWIHAELPIAGVQWHPEGITHKPESYYAKKYGYCIGDIISNAVINYLTQLIV